MSRYVVVESDDHHGCMEFKQMVGELVRCKECMNWFGEPYIFDTEDDSDAEYRRCREFSGTYTSADGYCYRADRKE